jgi:hypothetical protein
MGHGPNVEKRIGRLSVIAFIILVAIGVVVRGAYLSHFPMQVHNDESSSVVDGVSQFVAGNGGWALYGTAFGGHPNLGYWLSAIPGRILDDLSLHSARLGSTLSGSLSLIVFALFVWQAWGRRAALSFLVFAVPFHLHVHYSRTAFPYIHAVLFAAIVSLAFARFVQAPSARRALEVGIAVGIGALVYPATHVLPFAIIAAVVLGVFPLFVRARGIGQGLKRGGVLSLVFVVGVLLAMGPQLFHMYNHGYSSRLRQTFIFHPHNIAHLTPLTGDQNATLPGIAWFSLKSTSKFFYKSDSGEQYNYDQAPLPLWAYVLATVGALALVVRCVGREPHSLFIVATAVLTIVTSALMVEANFSPHLVLFSLIIPLCMAFGWDRMCRFSKLRNVWLLTVLTIGIGVLWGEWNWRFYNATMSPERSRIAQPQNYLLDLPVDHRGVTYILNTSTTALSEGESYYQLIYPNATQLKAPATTTPEEAIVLLEKQGCPCVIAEDPAEVERLSAVLTGSGRRVEVFRYPKMPVEYLVVDGARHQENESAR